MADPVRLRLLHHLSDAELSVSELVKCSGASQANVSKHLQHLQRAGLVARRKEGLHVFYRVDDPSVFDLCAVVCSSIENRLEKELKGLRGR